MRRQWMFGDGTRAYWWQRIIYRTRMWWWVRHSPPGDFRHFVRIKAKDWAALTRGDASKLPDHAETEHDRPVDNNPTESTEDIPI